jgi:Putative peptidoglycan binding domain
MFRRDPDECRVESEAEDDVHPLRRARPEGLRWRAPGLRDWAVALPGFLTVCVIAYAGQQSVTVSSANHASAAAGPVAPPAPAPRPEPPTARPSYPPIPLAKGEAKPIIEPVKDLADVIALSNVVVEAKTEPKQAPLEFQPTPLRSSPMNLALGEHALEVQRRLAELGYLGTRPTGVWGPLSRRALRSFKEGNGLPPDETWDPAIERALFASAAQPALPFVGTWASDPKACAGGARQNGLLHTVIESGGAHAGSASCDFSNRRQVGAAWNVDATCRDGRQRWTANIQFMVDKGRLTWTSERGSQSYVRCG